MESINQNLGGLVILISIYNTVHYLQLCFLTELNIRGLQFRDEFMLLEHRITKYFNLYQVDLPTMINVKILKISV